MVHSKPEYAESVKLLTYSQLRKLEKMDAKKEREAKLLSIGEKAVEGSFRTLAGFAQGSVTGPILLVLGLAATYPAWLPVFEAAVSGIVSTASNAWKTGTLPGGPPPLDLTGGSGNFCMRISKSNYSQLLDQFTPFANLSNIGGEYCFQTAEERDHFIAAYKDKLGLFAGLYNFQVINK